MASTSTSHRLVQRSCTFWLLRSQASQSSHRLFSTRTLSARTSALRIPSRITPTSSFGIRHASSSSSSSSKRNNGEKDGWSRHRAQYNYDPFTLHPEAKHYSYPLVTADQLAAISSSSSTSTSVSFSSSTWKEPLPKISRGPGGRPREVRMLARDFIHDSLYNPSYGYFTKQAVLLPDPSPSPSPSPSSSPPPPPSSSSSSSSSSSEAAGSSEEDYKEVGGEWYKQEMGLLRPADPSFDFNSIKNESEFMRLVEERYHLFEEQISILVQDYQNKIDAESTQKAFSNSTSSSSSLLAQERAERLARRKSLQHNPSLLSSSSSSSSSSGSGDDGENRETVPVYSARGLEQAQMRGRAMQREGVSESDVQSMAAKQVWHTPTQIFQPYYAHAIARYLVAEYKLHNYPYDDLVIYECGAGSGALAKGILDYLCEMEPEIYTRTRYRIVEISPRLAEEQTRKLRTHLSSGVGSGARVEVVNQDVLNWDQGVVQEPCFVIALEVFDNLAHDVVRFGMEDLKPYQAVISIDDTGDMHELWQPLSDPYIQKYLSIIGPNLSAHSSSSSSSLLSFLPDGVRGALARHAPFFPNLTEPIFVPTNAMRLVEKLNTHFPQHRLIMSDFDSLPDALRGVNAPVVQTRYRGTMIPVSTYLVLQGYFDIFFPTNFDHLKKVYRTILNTKTNSNSYHHKHMSSTSASVGGGEGGITGDFFSSHFSHPTEETTGHNNTGWRSRQRTLKVLHHAEFLDTYAQVEKLQLKDGSNPLLSWYANASWFLS